MFHKDLELSLWRWTFFILFNLKRGMILTNRVRNATQFFTLTNSAIFFKLFLKKNQGSEKKTKLKGLI
ncbi:MAG: hypothetical protein BGO77_04120 [Caedibacter sp. 37-49]|nr:MAG: hypothetical protein BGO77_04120 [Caedibacter sp. 37-49]